MFDQNVPTSWGLPHIYIYTYISFCLAKAVPEVLGDGIWSLGSEECGGFLVADFLSPGKMALKFVTGNFATFFTARKEICHLELTLGASSPNFSSSAWRGAPNGVAIDDLNKRSGALGKWSKVVAPSWAPLEELYDFCFFPDFVRNLLPGAYLCGRFGPDKKIVNPPPQKKNSPIFLRHPPGSSAPPPPRNPPPPEIFNKNRSPPVLAPRTPPSPSPSRKKLKISKTSTKQF